MRYLFGCVSNVHPPPRSSTKAAVGLGSTYYVHRPQHKAWHKKSSFPSHWMTANETYCESPRQGELIQPLLNWSEHSPPQRVNGGAGIVQEPSLESVEPRIEGLKSQSYSLYDPRGLRWGSLGGSAAISFLFVSSLLHRMGWILSFILMGKPLHRGTFLQSQCLEGWGSRIDFRPAGLHRDFKASLNYKRRPVSNQSKEDIESSNSSCKDNLI